LLPDGGLGGTGSAGISSAGTSAGGTGGTTGTAGTGVAADGGISLQPIVIDQCGAGNASGLADADLKTLMAGAGMASGMRYLYPYDGTVFPRGLIPPLLMWEGSDAAVAVYVHIKSSLFDYKGCLKPTAAGQLQLPEDVWRMAEAQTQGSSDPFTIELSALDGGVAKGPITEKVIVAQATLKGSIFYNSYASKLSSGQGCVLRVIPGKQVEIFVGGGSVGCNGCHAVSANGTRLVSLLIPTAANVYALEPNSMPNPPVLKGNAAASFVGLSPSGDVYLTTTTANGFGVRAGGTAVATLYETDTGTVITGTGIPEGAMMPTFSADGSLLVFNDFAVGAGKALSLMDYDAKARTASQARMLYMADGDKLPSWPFVLPDNKAVVFQLGTKTDFSGGNVGIGLDGFGLPIPGPTTGPYGNLFLADIAAGGATMLAKAMGYATPADAASRTSYLPFATDELDMNYYPTVSPVAAGGYFWVFFDSERHYGNRGLFRQLWGTAVSVSQDGTYTTDPSHPAFFLTGQEEGTGNHRAFTALDPCKAEGETCTTGIDCCGGFCTDGICGKPAVPRCSNTDETCKTQADCCNKDDSCIAGFCGQIIVQ
jgi:hypothetical protein